MPRDLRKAAEEKPKAKKSTVVSRKLELDIEDDDVEEQVEEEEELVLDDDIEEEVLDGEEEGLEVEDDEEEVEEEVLDEEDEEIEEVEETNETEEEVVEEEDEGVEEIGEDDDELVEEHDGGPGRYCSKDEVISGEPQEVKFSANFVQLAEVSYGQSMTINVGGTEHVKFEASCKCPYNQAVGGNREEVYQEIKEFVDNMILEDVKAAKALRSKKGG
jgi:hypothetical protein